MSGSFTASFLIGYIQAAELLGSPMLEEIRDLQVFPFKENLELFVLRGKEIYHVDGWNSVAY